MQLQLADINDVAAGAAWAEEKITSSDDDEHVAPKPLLSPPPQQQRVLLLKRVSHLRIAQAQPRRNRYPTPASAAHLTQPNNPDSSLSSLESRLKLLAVDPDSLVDAPQSLIEQSIASLEALTKSVLLWWERHQHTADDSNDRNSRSLSDWDVSISQPDLILYQRMKSLLDRIDQEIALCEQFLAANADNLRIENILNDDDSLSITESNIISTSEETPSEPPAFPPPAQYGLRSPSITSTSSSFRPAAAGVPTRLVEARQSRSSSVLSASNPNSLSVLDDVAEATGDYLASTTGAPTCLDKDEVFKWTLLRALSEELLSDSMTMQFGMPTVFTASGVIAVGTSRSMILVYDLRQTLKCVLGDVATASDFGAVTSLAVSLDHSKIAAGYACGVVCVWDVVKKTAVKTIHPVARREGRGGGEEEEEEGNNRGAVAAAATGHVRNSKVVHVAFVGSKMDLISADNEGCAFYHSITSLLMLSALSTTQLAANQPIYAIQPLPRAQRSHVTDAARIVAVATPFRLTFMRLKPTPTVVHKIVMRKQQGAGVGGGGVSCAALAWRPALVNGNTMTPPVLVATFGKKVMLYSIAKAALSAPPSALENGKRKANEFAVQPLGTWESDETIVAVHWINFDLIALLTREETIIVFDTQRMCAVERTSIRARHIVLHDYFSHELRRFGVIPEMAYFHNFQSYKGRLFLLGRNGIQLATLFPWTERLTNLVKFGDYTTAISMATCFYTSLTPTISTTTPIVPAVSGLPTDPTTLHQTVGAFLCNILTTNVTLVLTQTECVGLQEDEEEEEEAARLRARRTLAETCFETCLVIGDENVLFGEIYESFNEAGSSAVFLDVLEVYLLKREEWGGGGGKFNRPEVVQDFVSYFVREKRFTRLEQVILRVDPASVDVDEVVKVCEREGMYSALIYVYTGALRDYVAPVVVLLGKIDAAVAGGDGSGGEGERRRGVSEAGYLLFVYLAYVLTGKVFPLGTVAPHREALKAKSDVYNFLLSTTWTTWPPADEDAVVRVLGVQPYPYLRLLLQYDAKELVGVLSVGFEDSGLDGEIWMRDGSAGDGRVRFADLYGELNRQVVVDALVMVTRSEGGGVDDSVRVVVDVFVAKMVARYVGKVEVSRETLREIFFGLVECGEVGGREERQAAVGVLMEVFEPWETEEGREEVVQVCRRAGFWKVAEWVYLRARMFESVVDCCLSDDVRRGEVFDCVEGLLSEGGLEEEEVVRLKRHVLELLVPLVEVDGVQTAMLVTNVFPGETEQIIDRLRVDPRALYFYLRGLLEYEMRKAEVHQIPLVVGGGVGSGGNSNGTGSRRGSLVASRLLRAKSSQISLLKAGPRSQYFTTDNYNLLIQLMLQFEPSGVLAFLTNTARQCEMQGDRSDPYDFETVVRACLDAGVKPPVLWMLERDGQVTRALGIVLQDLGEVVAECMEIVKTEVVDPVPARDPLMLPMGQQDLFTTNPFAQHGEAMNRQRAQLEVGIQTMNKEFGTALALCQRKASGLEKWERESLWFRLLDCILEQHNDLRLFVGSPYYDVVDVDPTDGRRTPIASRSSNDSIAYHLMTAFRTLLQNVVGSMVQQIALPSILLHILESLHDREARFGELRRTITILLQEYTSSSQLFDTASRILAKDAHGLNTRLVRLMHGALRPMKGQCGVCRRLLHIQTAGERREEFVDRVVVFECRHIFHERCLKGEIEEKNGEVEGYVGRGEYWCVVCEVLNENGVRSFKRDILERIEEVVKRDKGKRPMTDVAAKTKEIPTTEPPVDLDRIYHLFDQLPLPDQIFDTLETNEFDFEDHISLNESFDDTTTTSTMHASTMAPVTRRLPARVLKLLDPSLKKSDLILEPPVNMQ
ncbi:Vacuolar protein sorting-associated protein 8 [Podochytrium sp. JEL0797]|nr:Vacuolar protein sorting-associated protein 8 [Podochytrium sp. JEL0797]